MKTIKNTLYKIHRYLKKYIVKKIKERKKYDEKSNHKTILPESKRDLSESYRGKFIKKI